MTNRQKTRDENLDIQLKEERPKIAPLGTQAEKSIAEKKIEFYKGVQAMRRESKMKQKMREL